MSWRQESAALARELASLAANGSSAVLTEEQLNGAMATRRELLFLLRRVLVDVRSASWFGEPARVGGRTWSFCDVTVQQVQTDPVGMLERALRDHPAPRGRVSSSGHLGEREPAGPAGWAAVGRRAMLAGHAWSQLSPALLTADERWSVVADAAAFAEVISVLDCDLLAAARLPYRSDRALVRSLEAAVTSGLRLVASETAALAAAGELPDWEVPGAQSAVKPVMVVGSIRDLAPAQDRLMAQLEAAAVLSPRAVVLVATGQARLLAAGATVLRHGCRDVERADRAAALSGHLAASLSGGHLLAPATSQHASQPVTQSREIVRCISARTADPAAVQRADWAALAAAVDRAPGVLRALARQADRAWRRGQWLVPDTSPDRRSDGLRWVRADRLDREPRLCAELSAVAARAVAYSVADSFRPSGARGVTPPRDALAGVGRARRPVRPPLPSHRPTLPPERG